MTDSQRESARLDRLQVADEDTVERVARAIAAAEQEHVPRADRCSCGWQAPDDDPAWLVRQDEHWRRVSAATAIAALKPAPGIDSSGQAVQREVERAAQAIEAMRPHIPPSTDPNRRTSVIVRSTLNRAARAVRAVAGPQRDHDEEGGR